MWDQEFFFAGDMGNTGREKKIGVSTECTEITVSEGEAESGPHLSSGVFSVLSVEILLGFTALPTRRG